MDTPNLKRFIKEHGIETTETGEITFDGLIRLVDVVANQNGIAAEKIKYLLAENAELRRLIADYQRFVGDIVPDYVKSKAVIEGILK